MLGSRATIAIAFGLGGFIGLPTVSSAQPSEVLEPAAVRAIFDSAFAHVEATLPTNAQDETSPFWPVWALARFRRQAVGWATLQGEAYHALENRSRPAAWLVVVPEGAPARRRMGAALQLDPTSEVLIGQIAPRRITIPWAGIFAWRQLSLLADYALGAITTPATDTEHYAAEFRGYQVELMVADLLSDGIVRSRLDAVLASEAVETVDDLKGLLARVGDVAGFIVSAVPADAAGSREEVELRGGFVLGALAVRYCELSGFNAVTAVPTMQEVFPR